MTDKKIKEALEKIRPHLQLDGGDVEFVDFQKDSGLLRVKMKGACVGCPMAQVTLQEGIGRTIMERVPEVKKVISV